eukprot:Lankesteria_metandrocarpae@DN4664_c0_g1_i1.p1
MPNQQQDESNRKKDAIIVKPIVIGSYAFKLTATDLGGRAAAKTQRATHRWTCVLRAANEEDQSYYIRRVIFSLHPSFTVPQRVLDNPPFEVNETGWGEFDIMLKIFFTDPSEQPVEVQHAVRLYPVTTDDDTCQTVLPSGELMPCLSAETHDELIFSEPHEAFYESLVGGPSGPRIEHPLKPYFLDRTALLSRFRKNVSAALVALNAEIEAAELDITSITKELEEAKSLRFAAEEATDSAASAEVAPLMSPSPTGSTTSSVNLGGQTLVPPQQRTSNSSHAATAALVAQQMQSSHGVVDNNNQPMWAVPAQL